MSKRWPEIQAKLQKLNIKDRTKLFNEFISLHPKWADHTVECLRLVVIKLKSQTTVTKELDVHKQIVNRAVMHFKIFLSKKKAV
jgi:hypothetical protein